VTTTKPNADVEVPEGTPDPLLTPAAANPSDLPANLAANTPLSYAQFSRLGLFLQRTQIGKSTLLPTAGIYNSGYTLYGSVLCNDPANARPSSLHSACHPEQAKRAEGPASSSTAPSSHPDPGAPSSNAAPGTPSSNVAPGAPSSNAAWGAPSSPRAFAQQGRLSFAAANDSSPQPHLQTVILSEAARASASSAAEGPATKSASPQTSTPFSPQALTAQPNFFTGIDTSIIGLQDIAAGAFPTDLIYDISRAIKASIEKFDPAHPDSIAPLLAEALQDDDTIITTVEAWKGNPIQKANALHELRIKRVQLNNALALSLGLRLDATVETSSPNVPAGMPLSIMTKLSTTFPDKLFDQGQMLFPSDQKEIPGFVIADNNPGFDASHPVTTNLPFKADALASVTKPYFSRKNIEQPVYDLDTAALRNAPSTPHAMTITARIVFGDTALEISRVVHNGPQPISIIPPVSIASLPTATVLPTNQPTAQLTATLHTDATTSANINVQSPHNWSIEAKAAGPNSVNFFLHPTAPLTGPQVFHVTAQTPDHHTYMEGYRAVGYPGLILTNYYTPATTRVVPVDLKLPQQVRIAYLPGTGDNVPQALASIGLAPTLITVADLTPTTLAHFDTVILGVRAYTAHPDLQGAATTALLDFARNGGNVLVQYQTSDFTSADAPYPLSLGDGEKVVDETAPVQLLAPTNALFTNPNAITSTDFSNWIEERGHGFLGTWDSRYTALTETHDPGGPVTPAQLPQRGGLITATVGKGRWTYCAFALYRQLPEAVPGAFRLFVNLLAPSR
jgi:hypothetical protein